MSGFARFMNFDEARCIAGGKKKKEPKEKKEKKEKEPKEKKGKGKAPAPMFGQTSFQPRKQELSPLERLEKFHKGQVGSVRNRMEVIKRVAEQTGEHFAELCVHYTEEWVDEESGKMDRSDNKKRLTKLMRGVRQEMVEERIAAGSLAATMRRQCSERGEEKPPPAAKKPRPAAPPAPAPAPAAAASNPVFEDDGDDWLCDDDW